VLGKMALEATIHMGDGWGERGERYKLTKATTEGGDGSGTTADAEGVDERSSGRCCAMRAVLRAKLEWGGQQRSAETGLRPALKDPRCGDAPTMRSVGAGQQLRRDCASESEGGGWGGRRRRHAGLAGQRQREGERRRLRAASWASPRKRKGEE
jgi:hypothetical protein